MKRIALIAGLLLMLGEYPAWAVNYVHATIPVSACRCYGAACTALTTTDIGLAGIPAKPLLQWTDSASASAQCEFWFPTSHDPNSTPGNGANFMVRVEYLKGGTGAEGYCFSAGYSVLPDETASSISWGALVGNEAPVLVGTSCSNEPSANPLHKASCPIVNGSLNNIVAYNVAAAANCTYATCAAGSPAQSNPGMLFIQREPSTRGCTNGATTPQYIIGFDVSWPIP